MTEEELKSIINIGELKSDLDHLKEGMVRMERIMEASFTRGGERMGRLEDGQAACDKQNAVISKTVEGLSNDVDKLERSKTWFITAIIGAFLAQITQWVMGRK